MLYAKGTIEEQHRSMLLSGTFLVSQDSFVYHLCIHPPASSNLWSCTLHGCDNACDAPPRHARRDTPHSRYATCTTVGAVDHPGCPAIARRGTGPVRRRATRAASQL